MLDNKIISMYQWIVDTTERKPNYLAEQVMWPSVVVDLVIRALTWKGRFMDGFILLLILSVGALLISAARNEAWFKRLGDGAWIRMLFLGLVMGHVITLAIMPSGIGFLHIISTTLVGSYYYFAACEAPRPKKRKEKLVLRTAT